MTARLIGVALVLAAASPSTATEAVHHGYWLAAVPEGPAEAALREALTSTAFGGAPARAEALAKVSAQYPGTRASGLAQLAGGLTLVDAVMAADALAMLRHPDVLERTSLADHALYASARALEASRDSAGAGAAFLAAADMRPGSPVVCPALFAAAEAFARAREANLGLAAAERALADCPSQGARALKRTAELQELKGDRRAAALSYDRLDREHPASSHALEAAPRIKALAAYLPAVPPSERASRSLAKAQALFDAGRSKEAMALLRSVENGPLTAEQRDLLRVRLGRCLLSARGTKTAEAQFAAVAAGSVHEAEAAYELARLKASRNDFDGLESVAARFPGTPWAERALLDLANEYQKDGHDAEALPYYRRMVAQYPEGRYGDRAAWRVGWGDYRAARYEEAALVLERAARQYPSSSFTSGFLYWAGRARRELRQNERARQLLEETVQRFKHTYHGMRAAQWLATLPGTRGAPAPTLRSPAPDPRADLSEAELARIEQLLLIDRLGEAMEELRGLAASPTREATIAWIEWRRGRLRPAISAMKRAYPGHRGEAGDLLPEDVWRILYPIEFRETIEVKAAHEGLDAALVAALVCQESTFDPGAVSRAGARGLMQVIPPTARTLARSLGMRYQTSALHEPSVSLEMGTRYLRQMLDRFGGRVERALAAYNAGPHRVEAWTSYRPDVEAEEFIESIPFSETRNYVMVLLASREHYRRLYALSAQAAAPPGSARP